MFQYVTNLDDVSQFNCSIMFYVYSTHFMLLMVKFKKKRSSLKSIDWLIVLTVFAVSVGLNFQYRVGLLYMYNVIYSTEIHSVQKN